MKKTKVEVEIEKLVSKYCSTKGAKELFRAELRYLVALAERGQLIKDRNSTMKIINKFSKQK